MHFHFTLTLNLIFNSCYKIINVKWHFADKTPHILFCRRHLIALIDAWSVAAVIRQTPIWIFLTSRCWQMEKDCTNISGSVLLRVTALKMHASAPSQGKQSNTQTMNKSRNDSLWNNEAICTRAKPRKNLQLSLKKGQFIISEARRPE